ncbi:hypothetical protein GT042_04410, partial [Streptomyces sp. SID3212]|nr:hypothetical protein [Streptomyces sp. SID3212]
MGAAPLRAPPAGPPSRRSPSPREIPVTRVTHKDHRRGDCSRANLIRTPGREGEKLPACVPNAKGSPVTRTALRLLLPALLFLASLVVPSSAVAADGTRAAAGPTAGVMCLSSDYPRTRIVNVEGCNPSDSRQRWTVSGTLISQSAHPGMCLRSDYPRTRIVNVEGCNASNGSMLWNVGGGLISQAAHPGMCLRSDYPRTRIVNVEGCN